MQTADLLNSEIWIAADRAEAKRIWAEHPEERHRIWLEEETWKYCLSDPAELAEVVEKKKVKPGVY